MWQAIRMTKCQFIHFTPTLENSDVVTVTKMAEMTFQCVNMSANTPSSVMRNKYCCSTQWSIIYMYIQFNALASYIGFAIAAYDSNWFRIIYLTLGILSYFIKSFEFDKSGPVVDWLLSVAKSCNSLSQICWSRLEPGCVLWWLVTWAR